MKVIGELRNGQGDVFYELNREEFYGLKILINSKLNSLDKEDNQ